MKKIIVLSLALVAGLFMVSNVTKAADALLDLEITAVDGYCIYGADLDLWSEAQSYDAFNMTGAFLNVSGDAKWFCNDTAGKAPWTLDISSDDLESGTYVIPATNIEVLTTAATVYQGNAAAFTGTNADLLSWGANIATTKTVFEKTSAAGTVGELGVDNVTLRVLVPANQEIWAYQSTITIQVPTMTV